jgi:hypothetical protein
MMEAWYPLLVRKRGQSRIFSLFELKEAHNAGSIATYRLYSVRKWLYMWRVYS